MDEIDEKFHGSVATFPSKEVYESMRLRRENHRKEANDRGVKMIYEVVGHLKVEAHSLFLIFVISFIKYNVLQLL